MSGQQADDGTDSGPVRWSGLTARGQTSAEPGVDVTCLGRAVVLDGVAAVSDGCQALELADATVADGTLTVTVAEYREAPEDTVCTQAVEQYDYVGKVVLAEEVDQVTVVHETTDGVTVEAECESSLPGDGDDGESPFDWNRSEGDERSWERNTSEDREIDWNRSDEDERSWDWNKSEDHDVDWNRSDDERSWDWNKSEDHDVDWNRSEGDRSWGRNKSEDHDVDWNRSEGDRSWGRNKSETDHEVDWNRSEDDESDGGFWSWITGDGGSEGESNNESSWLFG